MKIGYMRWSKLQSNLAEQAQALMNAGCEKIFQDEGIGSKIKYSDLDKLIEFVEPGDHVIVWRLDRIGRSLKHLVNIIQEFEEKGVYFVSILEQIDTFSSEKQSAQTFFNALASFEKNIVHERTLPGLKAARSRGREGGRKDKLTAEQVKELIQMSSKQYSVRDICEFFKISKPTYYRYLNKRSAQQICLGFSASPPISIEKVEGSENRFKVVISEDLKDLASSFKDKENVKLRIIPTNSKEGQEIIRKKIIEEEKKKDDESCLICTL